MQIYIVLKQSISHIRGGAIIVGALLPDFYQGGIMEIGYW